MAATVKCPTGRAALPDPLMIGFGFIWCLLLGTLSLRPGILSEFCWEFISTKKSRVGIINQREVEKSGLESEAFLRELDIQSISRFSFFPFSGR